MKNLVNATTKKRSNEKKKPLSRCAGEAHQEQKMNIFLQ